MLGHFFAPIPMRPLTIYIPANMILILAVTSFLLISNTFIWSILIIFLLVVVKGKTLTASFLDLSLYSLKGWTLAALLLNAFLRVTLFILTSAASALHTILPTLFPLRLTVNVVSLRPTSLWDPALVSR